MCGRVTTVCAMPTTLRPDMAMGHPCDWMHVGLSNSHDLRTFITYSGNIASLNVMMGLGTPLPITVMRCSSRHSATSSSVRARVSSCSM
jgi:hypothetical protein